MTQHATTATEPAVRPRFTVAHWSVFWAKPDASLVGRMSVPGVVGDWPGDPAPVRGLDAYRDRIAQVLERVPDLHLEVAESAEDGDVIFIHWVAHGTGANGPFQMDGIDRISSKTVWSRRTRSATTPRRSTRSSVTPRRHARHDHVSAGRQRRAHPAHGSHVVRVRARR